MGDENGADQNAAIEARLARLEEALRACQPEQQATLGGYNLPHTFYTNRSAIILPTLERLEFELKPQLVTLVEQKQFFGKTHESPIDHIDRFEKICTLNRYNEVSPEYLKCLLFEFSLADKAAGWLSSLPPQSLDGWIPTRNAFFDYFYTKSKTASLKKRITNFKQNSGESFSEVWGRFKVYIRECPHHGYTDIQQLCFLYDGLDWDHKNQLDTASNGSFMKRNVADAKTLLENFAESTRGFDKTRKVNSVETLKIDDIAMQVAQILQANRSEVHAVEYMTREHQYMESNDEELNLNDERNFKQGQNPNFKIQPNFATRSNYIVTQPNKVYLHHNTLGTNQSFQAPAGFQQGFVNPLFDNSVPPVDKQDDELKSMMHVFYENQQKSTMEVNVKIDGMYTELNEKFKALSNYVRRLDVQVATTAESIKPPQGVLPGKPERNPRNENVNAVNLRSGRTLVSREKEPGSTSKPFNRDETVEVEDLTATEKPEKITKTPTPIPKAVPVERVYVPKAPYPTRPKKKVKDLEEAKCKEMLDGIEVKCKLETAMKLMPSMRSTMKGLITSKKSDDEECILLTKECNAVLLSKMPTKLPDPGRFVLSVNIGSVNFSGSLCDLGSSVNVMPLTVAKRLGLTNFKTTRISLIFADRSVRYPVGILEDVVVRIGGALIPTDFVVLELKEEPKDPLILGRPFLCTAGAVIDVKNELIKLHPGDIMMQFQAVKHAPNVRSDAVVVEEPKKATNCFPDTIYHAPSPKKAMQVKTSKPPWNKKVISPNLGKNKEYKQDSIAVVETGQQFEPPDETPDDKNGEKFNLSDVMGLFRKSAEKNVKIVELTVIPEKARKKVKYRSKDVENDVSASILSS